MTGNPKLRAGGAWLTLGAVILAMVLVGHGPLHPDLSVQMERIANSPTRWSVIHWMASVALSALAISGLLVLTAGSRLTETASMNSAWAVFVVGALWTLSTAIAEVTVIADLAQSGDVDQFEAWWSFAQGNGHGFAASAVAVATIAWFEGRRQESLVPGWSATFGVVAGIASSAGWVLGVWFGVRPANLLWVVASGAMCLWLAWLGISMTRRTT